MEQTGRLSWGLLRGRGGEGRGGKGEGGRGEGGKGEGRGGEGRGGGKGEGGKGEGGGEGRGGEGGWIISKASKHVPYKQETIEMDVAPLTMHHGITSTHAPLHSLTVFDLTTIFKCACTTSL